MKNTEIKLHDEFGNVYYKNLASWENVEHTIRNLDSNEITEKVIEVLPEMQGAQASALLNLESLEIEYHYFIGNTGLQESEHLIPILDFSHPVEEGLELEDLLSEEEIQSLNEEQRENIWEYIQSLSDYQNRIVEASVYYIEERWYEIHSSAIDQAYQTYKQLGLV